MTDPTNPPPAGGPTRSPDRVRPSDADRETVATRLRAALDEGRLDLHEYDERLARAYAATTGTELAQLVADLPAPPDPGPVVAQIGDISVTSTTAHTPAGPIPLRGSQWTLIDQWMTQQKIPPWAIVLAILLFCLMGPFSLLFLLAKDNIYYGTVQVNVTNGRQQYVTRIPVASHVQVQHLHQQVNYVRSLAAL